MHSAFPGATIECVIARFKRGGGLVEAALSALARLQDELACARDETASRMRTAVDEATFDGDNLLVGDRARTHTTIFVLARQTGGGGVRVQTIEIDRETLVLTRPDRTGPLDRYLAAATLGDDGTAARDTLLAQASAAASSLSIVKSRLDLQESFLNAVLYDEPSGSAQVIQPNFGQASIRDLALAAGRQLDQRGASLGSRNRRTLEDLFARAMTGHA